MTNIFSPPKTIARAVRNFAAADPGVRAVIGGDPAPGDPWQQWIWVDTLQRAIENSQQTAVVIAQDGQWSAPNGHNTMEFPRLIVTIWADPTRNPDNSVYRPDAKDKCKAVHNALRAIFHDTGNRHHDIDGIRVLSMECLEDPYFTTVSDGTGMVSAQTVYGFTLG